MADEPTSAPNDPGPDPEFAAALGRAVSSRPKGTDPWSDEDLRRQRDLDLQTATMSVSKMLAAGALCLVVAVLLTSARLVEIAERQPFGSSRDFWLTSAESVDRVANALSLNQPADLIGDLRDEDEAGANDDDIDRFLVLSPTTTAAPSKRAKRAQQTTTTQQPWLKKGVVKVLAPTDRIDIVTLGDSQAEPLGYELINLADPQWIPTLDTHIATGLSRPDVFNWPAQIEQLMSGADPPESIVMFLGGNDAQDMTRGDEYFVRGSDEWAAEYRLRVQVAMDLMEGAQVLWVNQPPVTDSATSEAAIIMNQVFASEAAQRPWVDLVDADAMFADTDGGFTAYYTAPNGSTIKARSDDGVHLTRAGATVLAERLAAKLRQRFPVEQPAG